MTNNIAKIRAAIQRINGAHSSTYVREQAMEALAALSELEKAASEPVTYQYSHPSGGGKIWRNEQHWNGYTSDEARALYAAPPAPVAALAELERAAAEPVGYVTPTIYRMLTSDDPIDRSAAGRYAILFASNDRADTSTMPLYAAPPAPVAEIREPSDDECRDIWREAKANEGDGSKVCAGRAMFDAVRAVMWPREGL